MPKRHLLASAVAAALAGAASPAAAVFTAGIDQITDFADVVSNTEAYDTWASTCPNVSAGGTGCGDAGGALNSSETLFFWGNQGAFDNSSIEIEWGGESPSEVIRSVRIQTTGTTPLGAPSGPRPVSLTGIGNVLTFDGDPSQGQGYFLAYGRDTYAEGYNPFTDPPEQAEAWATTFAAVLPTGAQFLAAVDGPGAGGPTELAIDLAPGSNMWTSAGAQQLAAVPSPQEPAGGWVLNLPSGDRGVLNQGDKLTIELYVSGASPDVPGDVPVGYMDDIRIQLNPGPRLTLTSGPDPVDLGYVRAGTAQLGDTGGVTAANNQAPVPGNTALEGAFRALTGTRADTVVTSDEYGSPMFGPTQAGLTQGQSQQRGYRLSAEGVSLSLSDAGSGGLGVGATQGFTVDANDFGGNQSVAITGDIVGPVLGVEASPTPGTPAQTLAYGSRISLDTVDPGADCFDNPTTCPAAILAVGNLFGVDLSGVDEALTNLTISNVGLDGADAGTFAILDAGCASEIDYSVAGPDGIATGGFDLPGMCLRFTPPSGKPGGRGTVIGSGTDPDTGLSYTDYEVTFSASLEFFTDMNLAYGTFPDIDADPFTYFDLLGAAVYRVTEQTPAPGPLALIAVGLAGLGGLRARRRCPGDAPGCRR